MYIWWPSLDGKEGIGGRGRRFLASSSSLFFFPVTGGVHAWFPTQHTLRPWLGLQRIICAPWSVRNPSLPLDACSPPGCLEPWLGQYSQPLETSTIFTFILFLCCQPQCSHSNFKGLWLETEHYMVRPLWINQPACHCTKQRDFTAQEFEDQWLSLQKSAPSYRKQLHHFSVLIS